MAHLLELCERQFAHVHRFHGHGCAQVVVLFQGIEADKLARQVEPQDLFVPVWGRCAALDAA